MRAMLKYSLVTQGRKLFKERISDQIVDLAEVYLLVEQYDAILNIDSKFDKTIRISLYSTESG